MYGKLFVTMYDGTLARDWQVRMVFMDLLILADRDGLVEMTADAIAARTRVPLEIVTRGLEALESPDVESRRPDENGRRIKRIDPARSWGWQIVNFKYYHGLRTAEERREYMREYMRERRGREKVNKKANTDLPQDNESKRLAGVSMLADTDTDTDKDNTYAYTIQNNNTSTDAVRNDKFSELRDSSERGCVMVFPLSGKDLVKEFRVQTRDVKEWQESFPGVDVMQSLRECRQWNLDNPTRRKTARGIRRHIFTWLEKRQNRGVGGGGKGFERRMEDLRDFDKGGCGDDK